MPFIPDPTKSLEDNPKIRGMLIPAQERLKKYTPEELCRKACISFDEEKREFTVPSMGLELRVSYPDFAVTGALGLGHMLTILQYMDTADGCQNFDYPISLQQMRGGLSRGQGFDTEIGKMFRRKFSDCSCSQFAQACRELGGTVIDGRGDVTAVIRYAPMFPVTVNFWEADDEFQASGKTLVDLSAEHYLGTEAAGSACKALVSALAEVLQQMNPDKITE